MRKMDDTGVGMNYMNRRIIEFAVQNCYPSDEIVVVKEPFAPKPSGLAGCAISMIGTSPSKDPSKWALTWQAYVRSQK